MMSSMSLSGGTQPSCLISGQPASLVGLICCPFSSRAGQCITLQSTQAVFCSVEIVTWLWWQELGTVKGINSVLYNLAKVQEA